jgi:ribosome biogenesis GTPase
MKTEKSLEYLGYNAALDKFRIENNLESFSIGRVIAEYKERYIVMTVKGNCEAEITGNLRFAAKGREDFPAVGDWVALIEYDSSLSIIHKIFPRYSILKRQAVGQSGEVQIIAANIDFAFIIQAVDRDFNINRIERYLTLCYSSEVKPILVLSKTDLADDFRIDKLLVSLKSRIENVPVVTISNKTLKGYEAVKALIKKKKTYCMLGSSGVGKSTLLNNLAGKNLMNTNSISKSTNKGRHITSHRELFILENGGILIDNPGMREVGLADRNDGLEITFDRITQLAQRCRFKNCKHIHETGCAVIKAINQGEIDKTSYENYLKLEREKAHFESTIEERRRKDKEFGKMLKNYKKDLRKKKY